MRGFGQIEDSRRQRRPQMFRVVDVPLHFAVLKDVLFRGQDVAQAPIGFDEDDSVGRAACFFAAHFDVETQGEARVGAQLVGQPFLRGVRALVAALEGAALCEDVAEDVGVAVGDVGGGQSSHAKSGDDDVLRVREGAEFCAQPGEQVGRHESIEFGAVGDVGGALVEVSRMTAIVGGISSEATSFCSVAGTASSLAYSLCRKTNRL